MISKISALNWTTPFLPSFLACILTTPLSFFLTLRLSAFATHSSFEMMAAAGLSEVNLASFLHSSSMNRPERSKPVEKDMISKAFKFVTARGVASPSAFFLLRLTPAVGAALAVAFSLGVLPFTVRVPTGPFRNQLDSFIFWMEALVLGLGSRILYKSFWSFCESQLGHLNWPCSIFRYMSIKLGASKGR